MQMTKLRRGHSLLLLLSCSLLLAACGSTGGDGAADGSVTSDAPPQVDASPPPDASPPDASPPDASPPDSGMLVCSDLPDPNECSNCCIDTNSAAYDLLLGYLTTHCGCDVMAPCLMQCQDNQCAGMAPSMACIDCINAETGSASSTCVQTTINDCIGDAVCQPVLLCLQGC